MKNWIVEHVGETISILVIVIGNIVGYARMLYMVLTHQEQLKELKGEVEKHTENAALHRNPDFERRFDAIDNRLNVIETKLDRALPRR